MKSFIKKYSLALVIVVIILGLAIYYNFGVMVAKNKAIARFESKYCDSTYRAESMMSVPGYNDLLKQRGLYEGLVSMAESDSISLFVNIPDSTVSLMMHGVAVRVVPIVESSLSTMFNGVSREALYNWLSEPFEAQTDTSTIPKVDLRIKEAPKNSLEEEDAPAYIPDTLKRDNVYFILTTDRNLKLWFYQTDSKDGRSSFEWSWKLRTFKANMPMFSFKEPDYIPLLKIGVTSADAKAIFRALPEKSLILITF